jgi:methanethiol S-methyltransferase
MVVVAGLVYVALLTALLCAILFVGNLGAPRSIDLGPAAPALQAWIIDGVLLLLFLILHASLTRLRSSVPGTKSGAARALDALIVSLVLAATFIGWRPLTMSIWTVEGVGATVLWALFYLGWTLVLMSTFLIHCKIAGAPAPAHDPMYPGLLLALWATPSMSAGHLLLAALASGYLLLGLVLRVRGSGLLFRESDRIVEGQEIHHEHPQTQQRARPREPRLARFPP